MNVDEKSRRRKEKRQKMSLKERKRDEGGMEVNSEPELK